MPLQHHQQFAPPSAFHTHGAPLNPMTGQVGGMPMSHLSPPSDHPAPPSSANMAAPANNVRANGTEPVPGARKRGRPSTRVDSGATPPPEEGWWEDRAPSWHKDGINGGKTSMDHLMDWSEDMKDRGHYYWMGVRDGGNLHQGAARFRDYLYAQRGPIRRSSKAIRNKVENIKQKYFEAQEWLKKPDGEHITMSVADVEKKLNKMCRNYRFWETIFVESTGDGPDRLPLPAPGTILSPSQTLNSAVDVQRERAPRMGAGGPDETRNVRRRLNDGAGPSDGRITRVQPASYSEREREEREREKHDMAKKRDVVGAERLEMDKKRDQRDQERFEWEKKKHLVDTAIKMAELEKIGVDAAMARARVLYAQATDEAAAELVV
ncbi:hypothetical protein IAT38_001388 [Cryptococcus sp. DSM 104549]